MSCVVDPEAFQFQINNSFSLKLIFQVFFTYGMGITFLMDYWKGTEQIFRSKKWVKLANKLSFCRHGSDLKHAKALLRSM